MRAIVLKAPGRDPGNLVVAEVPEPVPGPTDAVVEVAYGGCNFADTMMRTGTYPHPKGYPVGAGLEFSGRVAALGPLATGVEIGDRVVTFSEDAGGFAERCAVPVERLIKLPDNVGLDVAAGFMVQGMTAWSVLRIVSTTRPGDRILVHAIGGGVGLFVTQLAVEAGAMVIGTVGTPGKERLPLDYGAARVVNRDQADFVAETLALTGGDGVDKVIDSTGAGILDRSFECVRLLGHVVSIGEAEGPPLPNLWERLVRRSLTFTRFHIGHSAFTSRPWREGAAAVVARVAERRLQVPIAETFAFEEVGAMYDRLESRQVSGKLLLAVRPE